MYAQTTVISDNSGNRAFEQSNKPITLPIIAGQPQTTLGQVGGTYRFSVTASGQNLSYQWYKDASAISGATSDTLVILSAQFSDFSNHTTSTGMYYVKVSNSAGTATSNSAALYLDSDGVGLPDWWQQQYFNTVGISAGAMPNGNGITNLQAYLDGTNPLSAATENYSLTTLGPILVTPNQHTFAPGTPVTLSVASNLLQNWTGDAAGSANPLTVTMNRNKSISAVMTEFANTHLPATLSGSGGAYVQSLLVQANGQIMAGGVFDTFLGSPQWNLGRINANGTLDTTFPTGAQSRFSDIIYDMAQQADGKVIVVGNFSHNSVSIGANPPNFIARLNSNGTLDETFMANGQFPDFQVTAVAIQSDGHILIGGDFAHIGTALAYNVARLNTDGSLDSSFSAGTGLSGGRSYAGIPQMAPGCLQIDSSGHIYIGGNFSNYNGTFVGNLARLTSSGAIDSTFSTSFNDFVSAITIRSNGSLYVGGYFTQCQGFTAENIAALTATGALDTTFNAGFSYSTYPTQILIQPNNQLLVALSSPTWQGQTSPWLIRLNTSGSLDSSFSPQLDNLIHKMAFENSGKIVIGGYFSSVNGQFRSKLAQLNPDGTLDSPSYNVGTAYDNLSNVAALQSDGKLLISGSFSMANNTSSSGLVRLNIDGSVDTSFNTGTGTAPYGPVSGLIPLSSGKTIIYGTFFSYNGAAVGECAQLKADGSLDTTFMSNMGNGTSYNVLSGAADASGRVIIGGNFPYFSSQAHTNIVRLASTGTVDTGFNPSTNGSVFSVAVDPQGRYLLGGSFTSVNGQAISYLTRLNSDGSLDSTFNPPALNDAVRQIAVSESGEIFVRGNFTSVGGASQNNLTRFTSSGALDPIPGQAIPSGFQTMAVQSDNSIILGYAPNYGCPPLCRVKPDGSIDSMFSPVVAGRPGVTSPVYSVVIGGNDDIYAIGSFCTDASESAAGIAHYSPCPHLNLLMAGVAPTSPVTVGTPITLYGDASTTSGTLTNVEFLYSLDGVNFLPASVGAPFGAGQWTGVWAPPNAGAYFLRVTATDTTGETGKSAIVAYSATAGSAQIAAPTISLNSGSYNGLQFVSVGDSTPGIQLFYTLDGSNPGTSASRIFLGSGGLIPILQSESLSIGAFYASGASLLTTDSYTINSTLSPVPTGAPTIYPNWWFTRGVIQQTGTPVANPQWPSNYPIADDYAVINQGQLKNLASQAFSELVSTLPPSSWSTPAGQTLAQFMQNISAGGDGYSAANLGQLKTIALPFYDLLKQQSTVTSYPWTNAGADDYSVANIGQAKSVFSSAIP